FIRSAKSGPWSKAETWEGGKIPGDGARVQIRPEHAVLYDVQSDAVVRFLHIAGTLRFAADKNTTLNVGLIKIQPGDEPSENGVDCDAHMDEDESAKSDAALIVGTPNQPIAAGRIALIRLHYIEGTSKDSWPAIVCCGGRMDFHGTPMNRTWVK